MLPRFFMTMRYLTIVNISIPNHVITLNARARCVPDQPVVQASSRVLMDTTHRR